MVRILNETNQEDAVKVMSQRSIGNNHHGSGNVLTGVKNEHSIHEQGDASSKTKNHNNNCIATKQMNPMSEKNDITKASHQSVGADKGDNHEIPQLEASNLGDGSEISNDGSKSSTPSPIKSVQENGKHEDQRVNGNGSTKDSMVNLEDYSRSAEMENGNYKVENTGDTKKILPSSTEHSSASSKVTGNKTNDLVAHPVIIIETVEDGTDSKIEAASEVDSENLSKSSLVAGEGKEEPESARTPLLDANTGTEKSPAESVLNSIKSSAIETSVPSSSDSATLRKTAISGSEASKNESHSSLGIPVNKGRSPVHHHNHHHHHHLHHAPHTHFPHHQNQSHVLPHLLANSSPPLIPGLHVSPPTDGRLFCNFESGSHGMNVPYGVGNSISSNPFEFYGDQKLDSMNCGWNQFPHQQQIPSGGPQTSASAPQMSPTPLPMALFPLPLDPAFPPAVLPSAPLLPNSGGGYSGGGHSRSSPPMPSSQGPNQVPSVHANSAIVSNQNIPNPPSAIYSASSTDSSMCPHFPVVPGQYVVFFHINPGVLVSFHVGGDHIQVIKGPMTVPLVSTSSTPPIPLPMQVPPGHVVQQIVDENGTLRSVIVSHQPPLMSIPFGPGSQSQPFFPAGPGFPSHFPPMQSGNVPCGMPSAQGPPTPPGPNSAQYIGQVPYTHKDERVMQRAKNLRRRYEQKQRELGKDSLTPSYYHQNGGSKKGNFETGGYNNNNQRRGVTNGALKSSSGASLEEDGSTGSVTSTGTQDEEEESRIQSQTDMLSALIPPVVSEVASRSALIKWNHPDRITESGENKFPELDVSDTDFTYEVSLNDKSQDNRFTSIFKGKALSCRVKALKPNTLYAISYAALLNDIRGAESAATSFTTLPDVPSAPACPRATHRTRNSINLKWNTVPNDNGSKIIAYVLEFDEGKGGNNFVEAYRGKNKQCVVPNNNSFKLQPAYSYQFRLAAVNSIGQSDYSPVITVMTQGCPPTQPQPPTLAEAGVTYLTLKWEGRPTDDEYQLQMEDVTSGMGFKVEYSGSAPHHACIGLQRNTEYRFRLKTKNDEGHSEWSEKVVFRTLPDRPGPPHKPGLKGRVHARGFKVKWEPPSDDGGVPVLSFILEIDQGNGFEEIYNGINNEFNIETLSPGESYALRVKAVGSAGVSDPSEPCVITTEPICPGKCYIPKIVGKPKSDSVNLRWTSPDWDGGSPINLYEVGCTTPDNQTQEAYRGKDTFCVVKSLLPGRAYLLQIRAFNRIGAGPWSDPLEVISGAGAPDAPSAIKVQTKTAHMVVLSWTEPLNNGSAITEYRVQMATLRFEESDEPLEEPNTDSQTETATSEVAAGPIVPRISNPTSVASSFSQVYLGPALTCEVKSLHPATYYLFRVQAANTAGNSEWSPVTTHQTPASSPSVITNVEAVATSDSITLSWSEPVANGAPVTHYNVSIGEAVFLTDSTAYTVDNLMADASYKVRVQAVNSMGPGPYSSAVKVATKPLPPPPPKLECVASAHFWMKLKWNETTNKNVEYLIQMRSPYQDEFQVVYRGSNANCKVTRLNEDTSYSFRICAFNGAGQGPFSDWYNYTTLKAPPPPVKGLRIERSKDLELFKLEWTEITCIDAISYKVQKAKRRDQDFKTVYRGEQNLFQIISADLDEGTEYSFRVCAIRHCSDSNELAGPYSNIVNFNAPQSSSEDSDTAKGVSSFNSKNATGAAHFITSIYRIIAELFGRVNFETRVAVLGVVGFVLVACMLSLIMHHVVS